MNLSYNRVQRVTPRKRNFIHLWHSKGIYYHLKHAKTSRLLWKKFTQEINFLFPPYVILKSDCSHYKKPIRSFYFMSNLTSLEVFIWSGLAETFFLTLLESISKKFTWITYYIMSWVVIGSHLLKGNWLCLCKCRQ